MKEMVTQFVGEGKPPPVHMMPDVNCCAESVFTGNNHRIDAIGKIFDFLILNVVGAEYDDQVNGRGFDLAIPQDFSRHFSHKLISDFRHIDTSLARTSDPLLVPADQPSTGRVTCARCKR